MEIGRVKEVVVRGIKGVGPEIVGAAVGAKATTILFELSARMDQALNPQVIAALQEHRDWWQVLTTDHYWSTAVLNREPWVMAVAVGLGVLAGAGMVSKARDQLTSSYQ